MIALGLDYETTGLCPKKDYITEVGAVLWDTKTNTPLVIMNKLLRVPLQLSDEIIALTGLTNAFLDKYGITQEAGIIELAELMLEADMIVAHNAPFDRGFYRETCHRLNHTPVNKPWVDTLVDVPYPDKTKTRNLIHLAAEHGFINPFAHRALFDVLTMLSICSKYDWEKVLALSKEPTMHCVARVSYADREKAKARGYRWEADTKRWLKIIKQSFVEKEKQEAGFLIDVTEHKGETNESSGT